MTEFIRGAWTARTGMPAIGAASLERALADGTCLDFTNSPLGPPGQPCTASFLDCLACSNAVATRRQLPRLAWLHRALDALRATAPRRRGSGTGRPTSYG